MNGDRGRQLAGDAVDRTVTVEEDLTGGNIAIIAGGDGINQPGCPVNRQGQGVIGGAGFHQPLVDRLFLEVDDDVAGGTLTVEDTNRTAEVVTELGYHAGAEQIGNNCPNRAVFKGHSVVDAFRRNNQIVVDDRSDVNLYSYLQDKISRLTFSVRFIRLEQNSGLSSARNLGVQLSKYSRLVFLDSDVVLPSNYLMEHSICLQLFPNCLFLSMKKNLDIENPIITNECILRGLSVPESYDDKRLFRGIDLDNRSDSVVESLSETDLYKNFGYGRTVSGYDLASIVIGHNMSMNKSMFKKVGGFQTEFKGWGMEDALFGAKFIARGGFIVPLLRTGVYHINHEPRSGSESKRKRELEQNIKIYKKIINQVYE